MFADIPFVKTVMNPTRPGGTQVYLGIGFVGSDGKTGVFAFTLVFFLWLADRVRQLIGAPEGTILLMDRPPQVDSSLNGHFAQRVAEGEEMLQKLLKLMGLFSSWRIVRYSEVFPRGVGGTSYEEIQGGITSRLLATGGYQVGWVTPQTGKGVKDEAYFARYFLETSGRDDIGFVLGCFPCLIPGELPGSPYLVKARHQERRLLLVEDHEFVLKKFFQNGNLVRIKGKKARPVLEVLHSLDLIDGVNGVHPAERFMEALRNLRAGLLN